jgi:hypothetical protein
MPGFRRLAPSGSGKRCIACTRREVVAAGLQCLDEAGGMRPMLCGLARSDERRASRWRGIADGRSALRRRRPSRYSGAQQAQTVVRQRGRGEAARGDPSRGSWCGVGVESAPVAGTGHERGGLGIFPLTCGPGHRERWRSNGGPQRLAGPTWQWCTHTERERESRWSGFVIRVGSGGAGPSR